jgi:ABC-type taurine transport system substrate-binding protein
MPDGRNVSPPTQALAYGGLIPNQVGFVAYYRRPDSLGAVVEAVADGDVDVGVAWGPVAGYYAKQQPVPLRVVPVPGSGDGPSTACEVWRSIAIVLPCLAWNLAGDVSSS